MSHLCVLICRVDDDDQPDVLTSLHRLDLPAVAAEQLQPETALDQLEGGALTTGQEVVRQLFGHQWQEVDQQLAAAEQRLFPPRSSHDGRDEVVDGGDLGGDRPLVPASLV